MSEDFFPTSRSPIMTYQRCPYRRFVEYHWDGRGVVPDAVAVPLATGGSIHLGLQRLLEGASADEAVQDALTNYRDAVAKAGFQDTHDAHQEYTVKEQLALTEVMTRAWALKRLPLFQQKYIVIEVEREAPLMQLAPGIYMASRPDGILENIMTAFYEILSFKTAKHYSFKNDKSNIVDIQGISETWTAAQKYGEHRIGPVVMEFLVTGPRKVAQIGNDAPTDMFSDEDDVPLFQGQSAPLKYQWNPLIRAWKDNLGNISWRFKMPDPEDMAKMPTMAKFFDPQYGRKGTKAEPKAKYIMSSFAVWEEMEVKDWFNQMAARTVFPQWCDPFENMFIGRKYDRMPFELTQWQREAAAQEQKIHSALRVLNDPKYDAEYKQKVMAETFPKYRHSCQYPTPCPYQRVCWEGATDPLSTGFKYRTPNHPEEVQK